MAISGGSCSSSGQEQCRRCLRPPGGRWSRAGSLPHSGTRGPRVLAPLPQGLSLRTQILKSGNTGQAHKGKCEKDKKGELRVQKENEEVEDIEEEREEERK